MYFKRPRAREGGQQKRMDNNSKQENNLENLSNPRDATTFSRELIANKNPTSIVHSFNRESLSFFVCQVKVSSIPCSLLLDHGRGTVSFHDHITLKNQQMQLQLRIFTVISTDR